MINVGSLGLIKFKKGRYVYVGSAKGPGGIKARIKRHLSKNKRLWWHIDYFTVNPSVVIEAIIIINKCGEKQVAQGLINKLPSYIKGFGSSDDKLVKSHLFMCNNEDNLYEILRNLKCNFRKFKILTRNGGDHDIK